MSTMMVATSLVCSGSHISARVELQIWTADTKRVKWNFLESDYMNITPSNKWTWPCLTSQLAILSADHALLWFWGSSTSIRQPHPTSVSRSGHPNLAIMDPDHDLQHMPSLTWLRVWCIDITILTKIWPLHSLSACTSKKPYLSDAIRSYTSRAA